MHVHPTKDAQRSIDLKSLTDHLMLRGIDLPILIRFSDILKHRLQDIHDAFQAAIAQHGYQGRYACVYPDQGQPAAAGRRGGAQLRPAVRLRPRGRAPSPNCWRWWRWRPTTRRSSATASRTPSSSRWRCWPRRSAARSSRSSRSTRELALILEYAAKVGVRPKIGMRVKLAVARQRARGSRRAATARSSA